MEDASLSHSQCVRGPEWAAIVVAVAAWLNHLQAEGLLVGALDHALPWHQCLRLALACDEVSGYPRMWRGGVDGREAQGCGGEPSLEDSAEKEASITYHKVLLPWMSVRS